jgi:hypothetical protein
MFSQLATLDRLLLPTVATLAHLRFPQHTRRTYWHFFEVWADIAFLKGREGNVCGYQECDTKVDTVFSITEDFGLEKKCIGC